MKQKTKQEDLMVRYLLQNLTEEEQIQIEEQFLADNKYFEQLRSVEDALIDDYAQGSLDEYERGKVESLLLSSQRQAREVEFVRDLIKYISENPSKVPNKQTSIQAERTGKWQSMLRLPAIRRFSLVAGLLLICIGLYTAIWNMALQSKIEQIKALQVELEKRDQELQQQITEQKNSREELETERRKSDQLEQELIARQAPKPPLSTNDTATLDLKLESFSRGGGELKVVHIPPGLARFQIRINLDKEVDYKSYGAAIKTFDGREIWSRDQISLKQARLVLTLPANLFSNDDYILTLKGQTDAEGTVEIGDYPFRVRK